MYTQFLKMWDLCRVLFHVSLILFSDIKQQKIALSWFLELFVITIEAGIEEKRSEGIVFFLGQPMHFYDFLIWAVHYAKTMYHDHDQITT